MKHLNPRAKILFLIHNFGKMFIFVGTISLIAFSYSLDSALAFTFLVVIVVVISLILSYLIALLTYHFYRYELAEDKFNKESGIIWKKYTSIPYERIQNVDIYRGVWARILGLSDLHIQTAGTAGFSTQGGLSFGNRKSPEGQLPGLSKDEAIAIRDELINKSRLNKNLGI